MFDYTENYRVVRQAAAEGMVLLKNEANTLPLLKKDSVGVIGEDSLSLFCGGAGSANVMSEYTRTLVDGLMEKHAEGKVSFYQPSVELAKNKLAYSVAELNELAKHIDKAIVVIRRFAFEGTDRAVGENQKTVAGGDITFNGEIYDSAENIKKNLDIAGNYYPHSYERNLFEAIEKSNLREVIVVLNIASTVDISFLNDYSKVEAILLAYFPGMEGGNAIADVLCGDVNPSGKLTDTFALSYEDYPSAPYFNATEYVSEYKEGIFVGYRYFETYAKDKVLYPFGFGLSYTKFELSNVSFHIDDTFVRVKIAVKNIGAVPGKEVVQLYYHAPDGTLEKPNLQLGDYEKTKLLQPGETETVSLSIKISDMASFDDQGTYKGAYVLEQGSYQFFVGNSVRNIQKCGAYNLAEDQMLALTTAAPKAENNAAAEYPDAGVNKGITLYDVSEKKNSIEEFVRQLTAEELICLSTGQKIALPNGTSGIGNMRQYGIPNPQTLDGPVGLRKAVPTTWFPCATLLAASFDKELIYKVGTALGREGTATGVDVLLGPGLNIHRNPLCGRNFEYYSEDPYVSGKSAAAMVKGMQSQGLCATIKHFFANNCELNRLNNNSILSERTARELYLKGFEIAVKESNPAYIMTSYNLVNGIRSSANKKALTDILRNEWSYEGTVMTDWRCLSRLWEEIKAGNNLKMPTDCEDELALCLEKFKEGTITRFELEQNVICVLNSIMRTTSFKNRFFGTMHKICADTKYTIDTLETLEISSRKVTVELRDGHRHLSQLGKDQRAIPTYVCYGLDVEQQGDYTLFADIKTNCFDATLWISIDDALVTKLPCDMVADENLWYSVSGKLSLPAGKHILKIMPMTDPNVTGPCCSETLWNPSNFAFDQIAIEMV